MCGITGFIAPNRRDEERERAVSAICAAMRHRGPDDAGLLSRGPATLGSCRLAIFDPANGRQPMSTPDGRWTVVFNGAIYNFRELRRELESLGWTFRTNCDTEALLASVAQWGPGCLRRLRGMYAFAAWDAQQATLLLARDPFGIKPLYLRAAAGELLFASELNALCAGLDASPEIDPTAVTDYLAWLAIPAPRTIYRDVRSLRPGEWATYRGGELTIHSDWSFRAVPAAPACRTIGEYREQLRTRLEDSIRAHLLADVPVGAFLSGGLDSAAVLGLMTRVGGTRLRTFCIGFEQPGYSEADAAAATARHFGAEHHAETLTGADIARDLDRLLAALDQPTGDGVNTYYASRAARAGGVTVALSGLGGDELFGGYPSFRDTPRLARLARLWQSTPAGLRTPALAGLRRGGVRGRKLADALQHARNIHEAGAMQRRLFSQAGRAALLDPALRSDSGPFHPELPRLAEELAGATDFEVVSAWELRTYMADVLLRDSDVMSMRHSLELRVPFIDRPLVEWLWHQPLRASGSGKAELFAALRDVLPPQLASRRKHGFTLPFALWMKRELRPFLDDTFSSATLARSGFFNVAETQRLWRGFLRGNDSREWSRLWSLAVLVSFVNRPGVTTRRIAAPAPLSLATAERPGARERTLLMAPEMFASEGGIPRILQLYLRALCANASAPGQVDVLVLNDRPESTQRGAASLGPAIGASVGCARGKLHFIRSALQLARKSDLVICGHLFQLPIAWLAQRFNPRLRYYLVAHGIEVWRPFSALERLALQGAARVLCVSDFTRRELLKHCPLPDARMTVLHNTLDPFFTIAAGRPLADCPPHILVVTRITYADRYKGVQHMIEAMPRIRAAIPTAKLRLVGRGDDVPRLQQLAAQLGVAEAVEFTGFVDDARLAEEMSACRLFALPSRKEGFGLVFLEAMAHGRPCLGADAGGIPEVITPESGVLVPYGDVSRLAEATIEALRRDWDQAKILQRARDFAFPVFQQRLAEALAG